MDIALNGENYCSAIHSNSAILLREHWLGRAGLECSHHRW
jgi:hypothetical protein